MYRLSGQEKDFNADLLDQILMERGIILLKLRYCESPFQTLLYHKSWIWPNNLPQNAYAYNK